MDIRSFFAKPKGAAAPADATKRKADDGPGASPTAGSQKKPAVADQGSPAAPAAISPADFFGLSSSNKGKGTAGSSSSGAAASQGAKRKQSEPAVEPTPPAKKLSPGKATAKQPATAKHAGAEAKATPSPASRAAGSPASSTSGKAPAATPAAAAAKPPPPVKTAAAAAAAAGPAPPPPRKWFAGMKDDAPPNKGGKRIPVGAADCLAGKTFVLTGTQDSLEREEMEALIKQYGGRVTTAVSGKTNYLVRGIDPETGAPVDTTKTKKAAELGVKLIHEDDLLDMIRATAEQPDEPETLPVTLPGLAGVVDGGAASGTAGHSGAWGAEAVRDGPQRAPALWAEKYRPQDVGHLVGNSEPVKRLMHWASTWETAHSAAAAAGGKGFSKAALLSGPPGIGKTSAARIVLKACGYDVVELNASDTRSQNALKTSASDMLSNVSIAGFASGAPADQPASRMALVMDEVDGMSSGDRGGMQALIKLIHSAKMPVICICNDRSCPKVKSLGGHCLDLRFRRPGPREVATSFARVARAEGYETDMASLERIATACNGDLRQMLNLLQMWRPSGAKLDSQDVSLHAFKDVQTGPYDVSDKFFKEANAPLDGRIRHYFVDSSMTPLLVQENYLNVTFGGGGSAPLPPLQVLQRAAAAAESIAEADVVGSRIVRDQQWGLAPLAGVLACAKPGFHAAGFIGQLKFPSWLGRNSTMTKRKRMLREATSHMQLHISASKEEVRASYLPALRKPLVRPLEAEGAAGVNQTLQLMDAYGLTKDDLDAILEMQLTTSGVPDGSAIPSNAKAALTRQYNKTHLAAHKVGKGGAAAGGGGKFDEDGAAEEAPEDEGSEEDETDKLVVAKAKKQAAPAKPKGKAKAKAK